MVIRSPKLAPNQIHSWINLSMVTRSDFLMCTFLSDPVRSTLTQTFTLMVTQSDSLSLRPSSWWWPSQIHSHSLLPWWWPSQIHSHSGCYLDGHPVRFTLTQTVTLMVTQSDPLSLTVTLMVTQSDPLSLRLYAHRDPSSVKQCPRREMVPSVDSLLGSKKTVASESKESCTYITLKHRHHGTTSIQSRSFLHQPQFKSDGSAVCSCQKQSQRRLRSQDVLHRDSHYMC